MHMTWMPVKGPSNWKDYIARTDMMDKDVRMRVLCTPYVEKSDMNWKKMRKNERQL